MSNPSVQQFYAVAHEGNFFHEKGPMYGPLGHLGQDYHDWVRGTVIPSWTAGTVAFVSKQPSPTLGYLVIVRRSDGRYAGFCHLNAPSKLALGQHVDVGTPIGPLGMTGSLATGYHLHATLEPQLTIGTPNAEDPLPYIHATLAGLASIGGETPIVNRKSRRKKNMILYYVKDAKPYYAVAGPGGVWDTYGTGFSKALGSQFGTAVTLSAAQAASKRAYWESVPKVVSA